MVTTSCGLSAALGKDPVPKQDQNKLNEKIPVNTGLKKIIINTLMYRFRLGELVSIFHPVAGAAKIPRLILYISIPERNLLFSGNEIIFIIFESEIKFLIFLDPSF
jgi:hypothetical protein